LAQTAQDKQTVIIVFAVLDAKNIFANLCKNTEYSLDFFLGLN